VSLTGGIINLFLFVNTGSEFDWWYNKPILVCLQTLAVSSTGGILNLF